MDYSCHAVSRRRFLLGAGTTTLGVTVGLAFPMVSRAARKIVVKASHVEVRSGQTNQTLLHMAKLVQERTNGEVVIEAYPEGVLSGGSGQVGIDQLVAGAVEMVPTTTAYFASLEPKLSVVSLPFLFASYEEHYAALQGPLAQHLGGLMERKGLVVTNWWPRTFRQLWNSKHEIRTVEQLKGLRIRTMDNPLFVDTFRALGARPIPMAWGEVYTALQLNAIDGVEPDLSNGFLTKLHEVCRFVTLWNYSNDALMLTYNKRFWDGLGADVKKVLTDAAQEAFEFKKRVDQQLNAEADQKLSAAGVKLTRLSKNELAPFKAAVQPVWKQYEGKFGPELMKLVST